jgi:serine/threonine protein phosphatase PrpC
VWKNRVQTDIENSFEDIHNEIINAVTSSPGRVMNQSGTTATILYVTDLVVVIANVGDSRAVISQWNHHSKGPTISAAQLTVDHIASSPKEQRLIAQRGGSVSTSGGIERVNGILAVSRSLGDIQLSRFLSRTPHVLVLTKTEALKLCGSAYDDEDRPCFIILASDGLW